MILTIFLSILWILVIVQGFFIYKLAKLNSDFLYQFQVTKPENVKLIHLQQGEQIPKFKAKTLNGDVLSNGNLSHHYLFLFKTEDCPVCSRIDNHLEELKDYLKNLDINLLIISDKTPQGKYKNVEYIVSPELFSKFKVTQVPSTFLVSKQGTIVSVNKDINDFNDLISELEKYHKIA